ncbi:hypothetical protein HPP92_028658 [Vanilla planifolia]|uniref:Uncharacterized protein n=1 Tax=Vanilla planifolia TaxID=51239 RepID=A0A835P585_VANPL|nr:hypothetical protein HPP92_028658 [Vanilla planifolia]KAG0446838.1 hypothetical protein HPP92_028651 [Vanilla planifolia]
MVLTRKRLYASRIMVPESGIWVSFSKESSGIFTYLKLYFKVVPVSVAGPAPLRNRRIEAEFKKKYSKEMGRNYLNIPSSCAGQETAGEAPAFLNWANIEVCGSNSLLYHFKDKAKIAVKSYQRPQRESIRPEFDDSVELPQMVEVGKVESAAGGGHGAFRNPYLTGGKVITFGKQMGQRREIAVVGAFKRKADTRDGLCIRCYAGVRCAFVYDYDECDVHHMRHPFPLQEGGEGIFCGLNCKASVDAVARLPMAPEVSRAMSWLCDESKSMNQIFVGIGETSPELCCW